MVTHPISTLYFYFKRRQYSYKFYIFLFNFFYIIFFFIYKRTWLIRKNYSVIHFLWGFQFFFFSSTFLLSFLFVCLTNLKKKYGQYSIFFKYNFSMPFNVLLKGFLRVSKPFRLKLLWQLFYLKYPLINLMFVLTLTYLNNIKNPMRELFALIGSLITHLYKSNNLLTANLIYYYKQLPQFFLIKWSTSSSIFLQSIQSGDYFLKSYEITLFSLVFQLGLIQVWLVNKFMWSFSTK